MQFNSAAFKAQWREACKKRKVDPVEGATTYQVAMYKAEVVESWRRHPFFARRWARPEAVWFWANLEVLRSEVEMEDVYAVLQEAKRVMKTLSRRQPICVSEDEALIPLDAAIREIWQELAHEMRRDVVHKIPLRDLQSVPGAAVVVMV